MIGIKLICVGKLKEVFFAQACAEYAKRLSTYCKLEIEELSEQKLPQKPSPSEIEYALKKEASEIQQKIPSGSMVIAMCIEGKKYSSEGLADALARWQQVSSRICFVIGGSYGLHEQIKAEASERMSMSSMTFPHHLARVVLLEQIYRGFKINEGARYHK